MSDTRAIVEEFFSKGGADDLSIVDLFADEVEVFLPGDPGHFPWAGLHTRGGRTWGQVVSSVQPQPFGNGHRTAQAAEA